MENNDYSLNIGLDSMIEVIKGKVLYYSPDKIHEESKDLLDCNLSDDEYSDQNSNDEVRGIMRNFILNKGLDKKQALAFIIICLTFIIDCINGISTNIDSLNGSKKVITVSVKNIEYIFCEEWQEDSKLLDEIKDKVLFKLKPEIASVNIPLKSWVIIWKNLQV